MNTFIITPSALSRNSEQANQFFFYPQEAVERGVRCAPVNTRTDSIVSTNRNSSSSGVVSTTQVTQLMLFTRVPTQSCFDARPRVLHGQPPNVITQKQTIAVRTHEKTT
ncbi:unnamed protein product [Ectocarpus sp. 12 AP-2014]